MMVLMMTFTFIGTGYSFEQCVCGQTITSDTTLECDLDCEGTAVRIGAHNITLDLNGYELRGNGTEYGVRNHEGEGEMGWNGVTIKDGIIDGFGIGVTLYNVEDNIIKNIQLRNNIHTAVDIWTNGNNIVKDCTIAGDKKQPAIGVWLDETEDNVIKDNKIMKNIVGLLVTDSDDNIITENQFRSNYEWDISEDDASSANTYDENKCKKSNPNSICQ